MEKKLMYKQPIRIENRFANINFLKSHSSIVYAHALLNERAVHDTLSQIPYFRNLWKKS